MEKHYIVDHPFSPARARFPDVDRNVCWHCKLSKDQHNKFASRCTCSIRNYQLVTGCDELMDLYDLMIDAITVEERSELQDKYNAHIIDVTLMHLADRAIEFRKQQ